MAVSKANSVEKVVVHPLVLLSIVDHYNRVAKDTHKRVVGVLLGETSGGRVDVSDTYAVPFEEDDKDPTIWFLDHNYHESMFSMFKKINAKERVVGWYSTGPKIRESDLEIQELWYNYCSNPVLVIIDVQPKELGIPSQAYCTVEEVKEDGTEKSQKEFIHIPSEIGAYEAEEIGEQENLHESDAEAPTVIGIINAEETLEQVSSKLAALKGLESRLREILFYLEIVAKGKLPLKHDILYKIQEVFNLLPNLNVDELVKAFAVKTNDMMLAIYLASLVRSIVALHNLINNKVVNKEQEKSAEAATATAVTPVPSAS